MPNSSKTQVGTLDPATLERDTEASGEHRFDAAFENAPLTSLQCGPFALLRLLGMGGMGRVYLAERVSGGFSQLVAIKLVRAGNIQGEHASRFVQERQILAKLKHVNIAALIDAGALETGELWIAMEYVDGECIDSFVARTQPDAALITALLLRLALAVAHAERQLVVHRDIKPSNVMIAKDGELKLLDFGIAKWLDTDASVEKTKLQPFSPKYAAPEQRNNGTITTATNVYQLGLLARELLPQPMDRDQRALLARALKEDPSERYASAQEMALDLQAWLDRKPLIARRLNLLGRAWKFMRRQPIMSATLAAAIAGVLVFSGIAWVQAKRAEAALALAQAEQRSSEAVIEKLRRGFNAISPSIEGKPALLADLLNFWQRSAPSLDAHADGRVIALAGELSFSLGDFPQARALLVKALEEMQPERGDAARNDMARATGLLAWIDHVEGKNIDALNGLARQIKLLETLPPSPKSLSALARAQELSLTIQERHLEAGEAAKRAAVEISKLGASATLNRLFMLNRAMESFIAAKSPARADAIVQTIRAELKSVDFTTLMAQSKDLPELEGSDLFALASLAAAIGRSGDREMAVTLLNDIERAGIGAFGPQHPFTAQLKTERATALLNAGELLSAERCIAVAVQILQPYQTRHPMLWRAATQIQGAVLRARGNPALAAESYGQMAATASAIGDERGALVALAQQLRAMAEAELNLVPAYQSFIERWRRASEVQRNDEARFAAATAVAFGSAQYVELREAMAYWQAELDAVQPAEGARFKLELAKIYLLQARSSTSISDHHEKHKVVLARVDKLLGNLPTGTPEVSRVSFLADSALWRLESAPLDGAAQADALAALAWLSCHQLPSAPRIARLQKALGKTETPKCTAPD